MSYFEQRSITTNLKKIGTDRNQNTSHKYNPILRKNGTMSYFVPRTIPIDFEEIVKDSDIAPLYTFMFSSDPTFELLCS